MRGRGLLIGGSDVLVEDNFVHTTVWKNGLADGVSVGGAPTNDSETILFDNTTSLVDGYTVRNNQVNGPLSVWKIRGGCRDLTITGNDFSTNGPSSNNNANLPVILEEGQVQNVLISGNTNVKRTLSLTIKSTATPDKSTTIITTNSGASGFSPQLKADFNKVTVPPRSNPGFDVVDTPSP